MFQFQWLQVFTAVAEEGNFTLAAKKLNLTQPTVSFHIDNLEKNLGCPLFLRKGKGVELSPYGQTLYSSTSEIITMLDETSSLLKVMAAGENGTILIGASSIPADYILPPIIAHFRKANPNITFNIESSDSQIIWNNFIANKYPIAVLGFTPDPTYPHHALWQDELVLACHPEFSTKYDCITLNELTSLPLVMRSSSSGSRHTIINALSKHNVDYTELNIFMEVNSNQALKSAILAKSGYAFMSRASINLELKTNLLTFIPLKDFKIERTFYAFSHPNLMPTCLENFWNFILKTPSLD